MTDFFVRFVNTLDPNGPGLLVWPQYSVESLEIMVFQDGAVPLVLDNDTYRAEGMAFLTELELVDPL